MVEIQFFKSQNACFLPYNTRSAAMLLSRAMRRADGSPVVCWEGLNYSSAFSTKTPKMGQVGVFVTNVTFCTYLVSYCKM